MRAQKMVVLVGSMFLIIGCASQKVVENNAALDDMMAQQRVEFHASSARPVVTNAMNQVAQGGLIAPGSTIGRIDLAGSSNFLKIEGDSVSGSLAYYGERRLGGGYNNTDSGINFQGVPETLEIVKDDAKKSYSIKFSIREQMEMYKVTLLVSPNLTGNVNIISSHRTSIAYSGKAKALAEKQ